MAKRKLSTLAAALVCASGVQADYDLVFVAVDDYGDTYVHDLGDYNSFADSSYDISPITQLINSNNYKWTIVGTTSTDNIIAAPPGGGCCTVYEDTGVITLSSGSPSGVRILNNSSLISEMTVLENWLDDVSSLADGSSSVVIANGLAVSYFAGMQAAFHDSRMQTNVNGSYQLNTIFFTADSSPYAPINLNGANIFGVSFDGNTITPSNMSNCDINNNNDCDSIPDNTDNCPNTVNSNQLDFDNDGFGDACDDDDDNDGVNDTLDVFPFNENETEDADGDGTGDNSDNCLTAYNSNQHDTDNDGFGDACDDDDDNDGVHDTLDVFPLNENETEDADGDGIGDNSDNCLNVINYDQLDTDDDGEGNACDTDDDNDGVNDNSDAFPLDDSEATDTDNDGIGDNSDNCPNIANPYVVSLIPTFSIGQPDSDDDGVGDACEGDIDGDSIDDNDDNCPDIANPSQENLDDDTLGDVCDNDIDGDGVDNNLDAFPNNNAESSDSDADGIGDNSDNCPYIFNQNQQDIDGDNFGDECDPDIDGDGWSNLFENHFNYDPTTPNNVDLQSFQSLLVNLDQALTDAASKESDIHYGRETDTDQDGISDALEVVLGGDPNDANDSGLLNQIKDYVVNSIGKSVPAMGGIGLLALGLSMLGLGAVRLRK